MATPLVLYKMDQASSGRTPTNVNDTAAGTAVNLPIGYGTATAWTAIGAGDGMSFDGTGQAVSGSLSGTKVATALAGATAISIEAVVNTSSAANFAEIFGFQSNAFDDICDISIGGASAQIIVNGPSGTHVAFDCPLGLHHLLAVIDTTQATAANRILLYVDGSLASVNSSPTTPTYPTQNSAIDAGFTNYANNRIVIGCLTSAAAQSFVGPIYFAALYAAALTSGDASSHSTALLANNDADPNGGASLVAFAPDNAVAARAKAAPFFDRSAQPLPKPSKLLTWIPDGPVIAQRPPLIRLSYEPSAEPMPAPAKLYSWVTDPPLVQRSAPSQRQPGADGQRSVSVVAMAGWSPDPTAVTKGQSPLRMPLNSGGIPSISPWAPDPSAPSQPRAQIRAESALPVSGPAAPPPVLSWAPATQPGPATKPPVRADATALVGPPIVAAPVSLAWASDGQPAPRPQPARPLQQSSDGMPGIVAVFRGILDSPVIRWVRSKFQPASAEVLAPLIPVIIPPYEPGPLTIQPVDVVLTVFEANA